VLIAVGLSSQASGASQLNFERMIIIPLGKGVNLGRIGADAACWYSRAGKPVCREPLDVEWEGIVRGLLG
jgi:hypothetical protein